VRGGSLLFVLLPFATVTVHGLWFLALLA
jgi:hypothetical protein